MIDGMIETDEMTDEIQIEKDIELITGEAQIRSRRAVIGQEVK